MNKVYQVAIIGGGASGLLCAIELLKGNDALKGEEVIILEGNDRVGKKLIATGNGQGNLTNRNLSTANYYGDKEFISNFIDNAKEISLENYFYSLGIPLIEAQDGKMYPISKQASAVLDILRIHLEQKKCKTEVGFKVDEIFASKNTFIIKAQHKEIYAKKVVLSTGGKAQKQYGTDGTSYALAERFGHEVTKLYPSLVQVKTELDKIKGLKGLKEQAIVTACDGSKKLKSQQGEVLFTDYGVSGSAVFQISGHLAKAKNPIIKIEFLPSIDKNSLEKILTDRNKTLPYLSKNDLFCGLINKKIGNNIVKYSNSEKIEDLIFSVKNFSLKVIGLLGFNYAQVTKGGVVTDDVNFSMESKLQKGLYLVGELLDVDGDCGGYNLTFAFVSGILAGKDIKQNLGNNKNS